MTVEERTRGEVDRRLNRLEVEYGSFPVVEETGVEVDLTGVFRARRKTAVHADDPDRRFQMLTVWFEGDAYGTEIRLKRDALFIWSTA